MNRTEVIAASVFAAFAKTLILSILVNLGKDLLTSALLEKTINDTANKHRIVIRIDFDRSEVKHASTKLNVCYISFTYSHSS